jgi:hypothetical protein
MYAIVIHANITDLTDAKQGLNDQVLPTMKRAPGFLGAYFVAVDDTHGISVEVFETEDQARAAAPPDGVEAPGVTMGSIQFGEVLASA